MTLFGRKPEEHQPFPEHVAGAQTWVLTEGRGRVVHEWRLKPSKPDNLTDVNGTLFFTSDGTALIKHIRPGSSGSYPHSLTVVGDRLYFAASDSAGGQFFCKNGELVLDTFVAVPCNARLGVKGGSR